MKILYHHRTQAEDAQGIHIYEMIDAFRSLGHHVEVVALVELDEKREAKSRGRLWAGIARFIPDAVYELLALGYNVVGYLRLRRKVRTFRPDMLYERYSLNTFCGVWISRRFRIPLMLEVNAPLYLEQRALGRLSFERLARFSERWICSGSTQTIVVSGVLKRILEDEGVPAHKLTVMPNGVNPAVLHPAVSSHAVRRRYQLGDKQVVGFVGWFRPWHGLEMLLHAFHNARCAKENAVLVLVGDGPVLPQLRTLARDLGLEDVVIFTGPIGRGEIPEYIAAFDVALQPSVTEYACPMKIIEYMAMGKCVVAPDQPNIRELLVPDKTGILFRPRDRESLARALRKALFDQAAQNSIGRAAHASVIERGLLWRKNAERVVGMLAGNVDSTDVRHELDSSRQGDRREGLR